MSTEISIGSEYYLEQPSIKSASREGRKDHTKVGFKAHALKSLLGDDKGDVSSETTGPARQKSRQEFRSRQSVLLCHWLIPKSK
ncbi:hypothetical protein V6N12_050375 [Hibiscus sabdariffa]|uniref:Uncharacterized protein n=1 Tax=Hibiscus sabdariffa TaxID=183260 RepID=A0ABR2GC85_9ROSI